MANEHIISPGDAKRAEKGFLLRIAELLHAHGTPAYRLERVLEKLARSLDVTGSFLSTPTSILVSFGRGAETVTHLIRVEPGEFNLGKLVEFDEVMEDVEHRRVPIDSAMDRLESLASIQYRYGLPATACAFGAASGATACLFQAGVREILLSFAIGAVIAVLGRIITRQSNSVGMFEPFSAFLAALIAMLVSRLFMPVDDRLVTLSSLIVLVPGLTITTALTELAMRHLVSGVARLAGAIATLLTMVFGVALAWKLGEALLPAADIVDATSDYAVWIRWSVALVLPVAFAIVLEARFHELGVVFLAGVCGFAAAQFGAMGLGAELGPFLGALTVALLSNAYARVARRPSILPMTPGILMLVPGSMGFRSLTAFLDRESLAGIDFAFQTGMVGMSLVGGILVANILLPPRRVM